MNTTKILAGATITGVALTGLMTGTALAWHPEGKIIKYVQNVSQNGQMADANDAASAVAAKPGDTLKYTIVVSNVAKPASNNWNDMTDTVMTDTLPAGVVMADGSSSKIVADLGRIKPGEKITKEYLVKVVSQTDGAVIANEACFTGDTEVKDNPQDGCDKAVIKVNVPPVTPPPTPEQPKEQPKVQPAATVLPSTGPSDLLVPASIAGGLGYFGNLLRLKRKQR
jgi:uncharacterized repeat protein (TIGR01451 family)